MGYYTRYRISCNSFVQVENFPFSYPDNYIDEGITFISPDSEAVYGDSVKWYEHDEDMLELSRQFPNVTFTLEGDGEEQGDVWIKHYKDGKMKLRKAITTFPEADEVKWF